MLVATRGTSSAMWARVRGDTARSVPSICATSGMTLLMVPPRMRPTVSTAGSNTEISRVMAVCRASTI